MRLLNIIIMLALLVSCQGQSAMVKRESDKPVGGGCEDCDLMYVGMPPVLDAVDTSAGWAEQGERLVVSGRVFQRDGRTPAADIVLYYWQTDSKGVYSPSAAIPNGSTRHGHIRGWVKTDSEGRYKIFTIMPAPYPGARIPAHIHVVVKEPGLGEYYVDDLVFDDDPFLVGEERKKLQYRGGSGILRMKKENSIWTGERNVILGLHIPGHPQEKVETGISGLSIGDEQPSFIPFHAWGPDKGSRACPVCKYGKYYGVLFFVGRDPDWNGIRQWLQFFEQESEVRKPYLKVYFVYANDAGYDAAKRETELSALGKELNIRHLALTYVPSYADAESEMMLNKLDPVDQQVMVIYKSRVIMGKYGPLAPGEENFTKIRSVIGAW